MPPLATKSKRIHIHTVPVHVDPMAEADPYGLSSASAPASFSVLVTPSAPSAPSSSSRTGSPVDPTMVREAYTMIAEEPQSEDRTVEGHIREEERAATLGRVSPSDNDGHPPNPPPTEPPATHMNEPTPNLNNPSRRPSSAPGKKNSAVTDGSGATALATYLLKGVKVPDCNAAEQAALDSVLEGGAQKKRKEKKMLLTNAGLGSLLSTIKGGGGGGGGGGVWAREGEGRRREERDGLVPESIKVSKRGAGGRRKKKMAVHVSADSEDLTLTLTEDLGSIEGPLVVGLGLGLVGGEKETEGAVGLTPGGSDVPSMPSILLRPPASVDLAVFDSAFAQAALQEAGMSKKDLLAGAASFSGSGGGTGQDGGTDHTLPHMLLLTDEQRVLYTEEHMRAWQSQHHVTDVTLSQEGEGEGTSNQVTLRLYAVPNTHLLHFNTFLSHT